MSDVLVKVYTTYYNPTREALIHEERYALGTVPVELPCLRDAERMTVELVETPSTAVGEKRPDPSRGGVHEWCRQWWIFDWTKGKDVAFDTKEQAQAALQALVETD